jgi:tripartite-type tricarboxylate transporter receptor subunit TctC
VAGGIAQSWHGLFARAGTPKAIVEAVAAPLAADLKRPETMARFKAIGIVATSDTPDEFGAFIAAESAKWSMVIRQAGIEVE